MKYRQTQPLCFPLAALRSAFSEVASPVWQPCTDPAEMDQTSFNGKEAETSLPDPPEQSTLGIRERYPTISLENIATCGAGLEILFCCLPPP